LVELLTTILFVSSFAIAVSLPELGYLLVTVSILVVIVVYDIRHYIIPDILTGLLLVTSLLWYGFMLFTGTPWLSVGEAVFAALAGTGFFYLLWFVSKGAWLGFGDVKLAFPLGLVVGPSLVFSMIVYSFWIGAAVSLCFMLVAKIVRGQVRLRMYLPQLTIKSVVPFAPFMVAGCLLALFTRYNVLLLFSIS
jgi:prepilin signal peptidase PulO-like enzyme (type II secretory pathway)